MHCIIKWLFNTLAILFCMYSNIYIMRISVCVIAEGEYIDRITKTSINLFQLYRVYETKTAMMKKCGLFTFLLSRIKHIYTTSSIEYARMTVLLDCQDDWLNWIFCVLWATHQLTLIVGRQFFLITTHFINVVILSSKRSMQFLGWHLSEFAGIIDFWDTFVPQLAWALVNISKSYMALSYRIERVIFIG